MDIQKEAPSNKAPATILRQKANEWAAVYFAIAMLGLMALLIMAHWAAFGLDEYLSKNDGRNFRSIVYISRRLRGLLLRIVSPFTNPSHIIIFFVYLVINIALCFYNLEWSSLFGFAKRLGWIATCNIALVTFLALRNNPLSFLIVCSHERLKALHQAAGYCTVIFSLLHAIIFTTALSYAGSLDSLVEDQNIVGIVAGLAMLLILVAALIFRKRMYELFYITHISLFILILITVGMHRPDVTLKALIIIIFAASIWTLDRIIRFAKTTWHFLGNNATLTPLAEGGIRIVLRHTPRHAIPGQHLFLWMPKIRALETHPFTIVSTNPIELVVSARDGFTRDLHSHACKHPDGKLRASIDGSYGTLPNFSAFGHLILIAGGSGASFTFGVATNLVKSIGDYTSTSTMRTPPFVDFIWVVREHEMLTWYAKELEILSASPLVRLLLHVTNRSPAMTIQKPPSPALSTSPDTSDLTGNHAKAHGGHQYATSQPDPDNEEKTTRAFDIDESNSGHLSRVISGLDVHAGRPDIATLVPDILRGRQVEGNEGIKAIVTVCGPESLVLTTKAAVAGVLRDGQCEVRLHCERFGW